MEEEERDDIFQSPPEYQSRLSRTGSGSTAKRYIMIIIFVVVIVIIILGVFKFFQGGETDETAGITPTPTLEVLPSETPIPTESEEETPTPEPTKRGTPTPTKAATTDSVDKTTGLDRAKLSVHVLNGSGVAGASKKASDLLEGLGYNVIQIGNADNFDYAQTEIQIIPAQKKYLPLLQKDLSGTYTIGSTSGTPGVDVKADAVVIVGKE